MACAGGDGTLMYLIKEAEEVGCRIEDLHVCILPYGTGNDLAFSLGWGLTPKLIWTKNIKKLTQEILDA